MKNAIKLLTVLIIFISCSSDDDNNNGNTNPDQTIKYMTFMSDGNDSVTLTFSNSQLTNFDDQGSNYSMTYSGDKVQSASDQLGETLTFQYASNRLDMVSYSGGWDDQYNYDSNGNIVSVVENQNDGNDESDYYTYSNGVLATRQIGQFGALFVYEFDSMTNPFYDIYNSFGFITDLEDDLYDVVPMFAKHNPTKITRNGDVILEVTYAYNSDGYPTSAIYTNQNGSGTLTYQYQN